MDGIESPVNQMNGDIEKDVREGRDFIKFILNKIVKIEITDGRTLIGQFLCTDRDKNIILGSCQEYIGDPNNFEEPRLLGLAMIPGRHVKSMHIDIDAEGRNVMKLMCGGLETSR